MSEPDTLWIPWEYLGWGYVLQVEMGIQLSRHDRYIKKMWPVANVEKSRDHEGAHAKTIDSVSINWRIVHLKECSFIDWDNVSAELVEQLE